MRTAWPQTLRFAFQGVGCGTIQAVLSSILLYPYTRLMRRYCRDADAVCAQSKTFAEYAKGMGANKEIPVFYLGAVCRMPKQEEKTGDTKIGQVEKRACFPPDKQNLNTQRLSNGSKSKLTRLIYLGSMGQFYDLETIVLGVIELLNEGYNIQLELVGEGKQRHALEALVSAAHRGSQVRFHGFLKGDNLNAILDRGDLGIIPMHPGSAVAVPYKLFDYLSAGLPVVNSLPGELQQQLDRHKCGYFYEAGNVNSFVHALKSRLDNPESLDAAKIKARNLFIQRFEARKIYAQMSDWLLGLKDSR